MGFFVLVITHTPSRASFVNDESCGVDAFDRVARGVADVEAAVGGAADADVRLPAADLRRGDLRVGLVVGGGEFLHQGKHGGRAADDQALGRRAGRHGEDQREDQRRR